MPQAKKNASIRVRIFQKGPIVKIVDLSRELYHRTPSYPGHPPVMHGDVEDPRRILCRFQKCLRAFIDVHFDGRTMPAPISTHRRHFGPSGIPIDEYPLEKCIVPGICIDLRHIAPRAEITPSDLEAAVMKAGVPVPKGGTVLLCTGHHERTFPRKEYSTDNSGVNVAATEWLAKQGVVHFGIDSMRPGPDSDVNLLVHKACLDLDITHMESLCNLEALLGKGPFTFIGLPMKWREGTASPIRAVAVFDM